MQFIILSADIRFTFAFQFLDEKLEANIIKSSQGNKNVKAESFTVFLQGIYRSLQPFSLYFLVLKIKTTFVCLKTSQVPI